MNLPSAKRARLTTACNECRRRKVRCDANYPRCGNCCSRNSDCFTSDPKRPDIPVLREWVDIPFKPSQTTYHLDAPTQDLPTTTLASERDAAVSTSLDYTTGISGDIHTSEDVATTDISPAQQPHDMSFNLDIINNRFKMMGGSSSQCLTKSLDIYLKSHNVEGVSAVFRHGMQHSEEMELPLGLDLVPFPDYETRQTYLDVYFKRLHVFYPITSITDTTAIVHQLACLPDPKSVAYTKVPLLATAYLLMSLGADELEGSPSEIGGRYLRIGAALAEYSVNFPYLTAVQCLLLLAVCYRGRNKDGMAWHTTGIAVRIAQSLGLHRYSVSRPSNQHGIQRRDDQLFHARIWAVCCCLEKMGQLESGRPSAISVVNTDQMMAPSQLAPGHDFLYWNMALAEVQHDISNHLYGHQPGDRTGKQILIDSARLDKRLLAWPALIPAELRPGNDILCNDDQFHLAAFLCFQYHQSIIAVHRAALIQPTAALQREIDKLVPDNDARFRLAGGEAICVSSARAIASITVQLLERRLDSRLLSGGPALLACVVLAIYIVKNPAGRMQLSDLELLKTVAEWTSNQFLKTGMNKQFSEGTFFSSMGMSLPAPEPRTKHIQLHHTSDMRSLAQALLTDSRFLCFYMTKYSAQLRTRLLCTFSSPTTLIICRCNCNM
jgi:hypothetical protein